MTITQNCQLINQKYNQLRTLLVSKLHNCYVEKTTTDSFTELIEAVGDIRAVEVIRIDNNRPTNMPDIDTTDVSTFNITLYQRTKYYMELLSYFLILKSVPKYEVDAQTDLKGLIELIDMIDVIKPSLLTLGAVNEIQYYGTNIEVPYTLTDIDGINIEEGDITIKDSNGIVYDSIDVGEAIVITPLDISPKINGEYQYETFFITYNGTDKYTESTPQTIRVKILPAQIRLILTATNMSMNSRYYNSANTGYEDDEWTISINTYNHQNQPLPNIPFTLTIPDIITIEDEETDDNGAFIINHQVIDNIGQNTINCVTHYPDTNKMSNSSINYEIIIKYNILKQSQKHYTDYTGKSNYVYEVETINEDTGQRTNQYDGSEIKIFLYEEYSDNENNGDQIATATIVNGKATYSFSSLTVGDKIITWLFEPNNTTARLTTHLHILSNFIFPEKQSYFLNSTPTIKYAPEGNAAPNKTINGRIDCVQITYTDELMGYEQEEVYIGNQTITETTFIGYETTFNEATGEDEYILDEHGEKIPIYETEEIEVLDDNGQPIPIYEIQNTTPIYSTVEHRTEQKVSITPTTINDAGELDTISNYKDIGYYELILCSGDGLNEKCRFKYELKKPFDIETLYYNKKEKAQYKITIYDEEDPYTLIVKNNNNTINQNAYSISTVTTYEDDEGEHTYTYKTLIVDVPISEQTTGANQLSLTINGYTETVDFKLINKIFEVITNSVTLGDNTMQIRCFDDTVTSIDIISPYITLNDYSYENNIFTVNATFTQAGNISFVARDESLSEETLSIQVDKIYLDEYIDASISAIQPEDEDTNDNQIAYIDIDKIFISFGIDIDLYSTLPITYKVKQGNNQLFSQSFTFPADTLELNTPQNLTPGQYQLEFIFAGDNNYYAFDKIIDFEILKSTPKFEIAEQHTAFKDTRFFIYQPEFTEENPETLIKESCSSAISSQSNGVWDFVGYYLSEGWANTGLWECDFDISGNIRYVGLDILCALSPSNQITILMTGWEGPVATNPPGTYTRDNDSTLSFLPKKLVWSYQITNPDTQTDISRFTECHINMKKTSPTTLTITKTNGECNNGSVTYEWQNLSNYPRLTIGSHVNPAGCSRQGSIQIKNFIVRGVY